MNSIDILAALVAMPTVSGTLNGPLIDWAENYLTKLGARTSRIPGPIAGTWNFWATMGPETQRGILLSGHSDVVPVDGHLALDHGRDGVRANAVCPSFVETPMADQLLADTSAEELEFYKKAVPIGRFARPDEVAAAVAHLSSSEASYVNGLMYKIDGGATAGYYLGN